MYFFFSFLTLHRFHYEADFLVFPCLRGSFNLTACLSLIFLLTDLNLELTAKEIF